METERDKTGWWCASKICTQGLASGEMSDRKGQRTDPGQASLLPWPRMSLHQSKNTEHLALLPDLRVVLLGTLRCKTY